MMPMQYFLLVFGNCSTITDNNKGSAFKCKIAGLAEYVC